MKLKDYLRDRLVFLIIHLSIFAFLAAVMIVLQIQLLIIFLLFFIWYAPLTSYLLLQFYREKRFLDELTALAESLDQKYLLSEVVKPPRYLEGRLYYQSLKLANKSMLERVNDYEIDQKEYREYVETWVHEIKTPIASARLIIDNHKDAVTRGINAELCHIDNYVEQALYYAKSNTANEDYRVRKCDLSQLAKNALTRNAQDLIQKNFSVDVSEAEGIVYSDPKWLAFILNQLIGNALKYCREDGRKLIFTTKKEENYTILVLHDNGIGIPLEDQMKVFDKGFTGENGRHFGKSTGIGLYLCKKLCNRLGIGIAIESTVGEGTMVKLTFPLGIFNTVVRSSC